MDIVGGEKTVIVLVLLCSILTARIRKHMVDHGTFICLEGLDGCGKTTQAKLLARRLKTKYEAVYTAEPSRGQIGKFIKKR